MTDKTAPLRWQFFENKKYQRALDACEQVAPESEEYADALCLSALCLARLGRGEEATRRITQAVSLLPTSPRVARFEALVYWELDDHKGAIDAQLRASNAVSSDLTDDQDALPIFIGGYRQERGTFVANSA